MGAGDTNEAIQMFDLLLEFLADGAHWTRGHYHDVDGRSCLIGALVLRRKHHASSDAAVYFLQEAASRGFVLVYFDDRRSRGFRRPALGHYRGPRPRAWRGRKRMGHCGSSALASGGAG